MRILNNLFTRDARTIGEVVKDPIVDVIITSPPYADLKDYGVRGQIGFGQKYESEYLLSLKEVFAQCFHVSRPTASLWVVADTFKRHGEVKLLPFQIAEICKEIGWRLSDIIIWDKGKTLPWSHKGRLRNSFEYLLFFVKSQQHKYYVDRIKDPIDLKEWWVKYPERYSLRGKVPSNIWRIPIPVQGSWAQGELTHFCPFPPELVERILLLATDKEDVVLDPFAGSGVVLAQAMCMRRKYVGFEINADYVKRFKSKVLPAIRKQWKATQNEMRQLERRRKDFEEKIRALRLLKYPKSIVKVLQDKGVQEVDEIVAIIVEEDKTTNQQRTNTFARIGVTFLVAFQSEHSEKALKEAILSVVVKPPASKFGIDSAISVRNADEFFGIASQGVGNNDRPLFIYLGGRTHYFHERSTFKDLSIRLAWSQWKTMRKNNMPPILSPIRIRQEIIKTWFPKQRALNGHKAMKAVLLSMNSERIAANG